MSPETQATQKACIIVRVKEFNIGESMAVPRSYVISHFEMLMFKPMSCPSRMICSTSRPIVKSSVYRALNAHMSESRRDCTNWQKRRWKIKVVSMTSPEWPEIRLPKSTRNERVSTHQSVQGSQRPKAGKCLKIVTWNTCQSSLRRPTWLLYHFLKLYGGKSQPCCSPQ